MNEQQGPSADLSRAMDECRELFGRLSERNRILAQEWQELTASVQHSASQSDSPSPTSDWSRDSLSHARDFGESLLRLHEQFFETCRDFLQARVENESLRNERSSVQSELARLSEQVLLMGKAQSDFAAEKSQLETLLRSTQTSLEESDHRAAELESTVDRLKSDLATAEGRLSQVGNLDTQLAEAVQQRDAIQSELTAITQEKETAVQQAIDKAQTLERVSKEFTEVGRELENARMRIQELERDLLPLREGRADFDSTLKAAQERAEELDQQYGSALGHVADLESRLSEAQQARASLEFDLQQAVATSVAPEVQADWKQRVASLTETNQRLEAELGSAREAIREAQIAARGSETLHKRAEDALHAATNENASLSARLKAALDEVDNLRARASSRDDDDRLRSALAETASLNQRLQTSLSELDRLRGYERELREELERVRDHRTRLPEATGPDPTFNDALSGFQPLAGLDSFTSTPPGPPGMDVGGDAPTEKEVFHGLDHPPNMDSLAFQEDDRLFEELTRGESLDVPDVLHAADSQEGVLEDSLQSGFTEIEAALNAAAELDPIGASLPQADTWGLDAGLIPESPVTADVSVPEDSLTTSINEILDRAMNQFDQLVPPAEEDDGTDTLSRLNLSEGAASSEDAGLDPVSVERANRALDAKAIPFPYPEITGARMESFRGRKILLVGGDDRFLSDYETMFSLAEAELIYFPSLIHLERKGMKRHTRDCDIVVVFGRAVQEAGMERIRELAIEFSRPLIEHHSSGLVSLYHRLQSAGGDL